MPPQDHIRATPHIPQTAALLPIEQAKRGSKSDTNSYTTVWTYLIRGPEEVATERHHPALVRLFQQLGRVLGRFRGKGIVVSGVETFARQQGARHRDQRPNLLLAVGQLVLVQNERLQFPCMSCVYVCVCVYVRVHIFSFQYLFLILTKIYRGLAAE